ncbi:hypothetical protein [Rhodococcus daqingensis]|uniref:Uncharacterized protein n=1 Tax=Rhodococcus daqingensis TaxID=2479363 RepID=A0ABW2RUM6_9NOCA
MQLARRLSAIAPEELVHFVTDKAQQWNHRRSCADALVGRLPSGSAADLLAILRDPTETSELRRAVLDLLTVSPGPHSGEVLAWAKLQAGGVDGSDVLGALGFAALIVRAELGDTSAALALVERATDPWDGVRAEHAIDALITSYGADVVFGGSPNVLMLSGETPGLRLLGVRLSDRVGIDVSPALADESTMVARTAFDLLTARYRDGRFATGVVAGLTAMATRAGPGQVWAMAVLARRFPVDVRKMWNELGPRPLDVPGLPTDVRDAMVREYAPGQRDTDPRWILEAALQPSIEDRDDEAPVRAAMTALKAAGVEPGEPVPAGVDEGCGGGTYFRIHTAEGDVMISTLGPFFQTQRDAIAELLTSSVGFRRIDDRLAEVVVDGLCVYFFGDRGPLCVRDLLFYWQD